MIFPITSLYAIPLAVIFLILWVCVTRARTITKVSFGDAGHVGLHEYIRRHGNFVEWTPMILILMMLAEGQGVRPFWLHVGGTLVVVGRALHPFGLWANAPGHLYPLRIIGNVTCILATLILATALALAALGLHL